MAQRKKARPVKRINPSRFNIVQAEKTLDDAKRYKKAFERLSYSYYVIPDKNNLEQIKRTEFENKRNKAMMQEQVALDDVKALAYLCKPNYTSFFLQKDGEDIGMATVLFPDSSSAFIDNLYVFKHLNGYGSMFYKLLEGHFKAQNINNITLDCGFNGAKVFWKKMGFTALSSSTFLNSEIVKFIKNL